MLKSIYKLQKGYLIKNCCVLNVQSEHLGENVDLVKSSDNGKIQVSEARFQSGEQKSKENSYNGDNFKKAFNFDEFRNINSNFYFFEALGLGTAVIAGIRFKLDTERYQRKQHNHLTNKPWCPAICLKNTTIYLLNSGFNVLHPTSSHNNGCIYKFFKSNLPISSTHSEDSLKINKYLPAGNSSFETYRTDKYDEEAFDAVLRDLQNIYTKGPDRIIFYQQTSTFSFDVTHKQKALLDNQPRQPTTTTYETTVYDQIKDQSNDLVNTQPPILNNQPCILNNQPPNLNNQQSNLNNQQSIEYNLHSISSKSNAYSTHIRAEQPIITFQPPQDIPLKPSNPIKSKSQPTTEQQQTSSKHTTHNKIFKQLLGIKQQLHNNNLNHHATQLAGKGDYGGAVVVWKRVIQLDPTHHKALYNLALCHQKALGVNKDLEKALSLYRRSGEQGNQEAIIKVESLILQISQNAIYPEDTFRSSSSSLSSFSSLPSSSSSFSSLSSSSSFFSPPPSYISTLN